MRDPERPTKPASAWLLFLADFRKGAAAKSLGNKEVMSTAATKWKAMSASERAPFEGPAKSAQDRYRKAMDAYLSSGKKDAWARDPEKPKRPLTAFFLYATKFREQNPGMKKVTEVTKQANVQWKALSEAQKAPFVQQAEAAKAKYAQDIAKYKASGKELAWQTKVGITDALRKKSEAAAKAKEAANKKKMKAKEVAERKKARLKELAAKKKAKAQALAAKAKELLAQKKEKAKLKIRQRRLQAQALAAKKKKLLAQKKEKAKLQKEADMAKKKAAAEKAKLSKLAAAMKAKEAAAKDRLKKQEAAKKAKEKAMKAKLKGKT